MNEQTTNWQNPFNLIDQDIAAQESNQVNVSTAVQPANDVASTENTTATNSANNETTAPATPQKKDMIEEIIWKAAKFFAKLTWQPDPETGAPANSSTTNTQQPATNTENPWNTENTTPQKIDFNSVMSGVTGFMDKVWQSKIVWNMTWFLDKVWDKIEEKTGINLGTTPTTKNTENQNTTETPAETVQTETPTVQAETTTPQAVETQASVQPETPTQPAEPQTPVQQ